MEDYWLKNILKSLDTLNSRFWEINMETMFIYLKENAVYKEEIKKLLKKPLAQLWTKLPDTKWEPKL